MTTTCDKWYSLAAITLLANEYTKCHEKKTMN